MFSNSTNDTSGVSNERIVKPGEALELTFLVLLMFFIIFGNILVCLAFNTVGHRLKTITNYFVVNLACSDILVGVFSLPLWISVRTGESRIKHTVKSPGYNMCVVNWGHSVHIWECSISKFHLRF